MEKPFEPINPTANAVMTTEQKIALYDERLTRMIANPESGWTPKVDKVTAYKARLEKMTHSERVLYEEEVQKAVDIAMAMGPREEKSRDLFEDKTQIINPASE
jgi:hypothetical protein